MVSVSTTIPIGARNQNGLGGKLPKINSPDTTAATDRLSTGYRPSATATRRRAAPGVSGFMDGDSAVNGAQAGGQGRVGVERG